MHIVLLSGGSGKRLWPLSNDIRSKQFIPIFRQADGTCLSMAQRVYGQIRSVDPDADVTIATSKAQVSTLLHQLGDDAALFRGAVPQGYVSCDCARMCLSARCERRGLG